jgi:carbon-monoxide dehydrogenase small subunit
MMLTAVSLLRRNPEPTIEEIREAIAGNTCRCSGYVKVIEAIELAGKKMSEGGGR